jgi:hypothetical protein
MTEPDKRLETVNRSGYPLQVATARAVTARTPAHGWRVLHEEHSWHNDFSETDGFIDLVLEHPKSEVVLVVECRRLQDKEWILLPADGNPQGRRYVRALHSKRKGGVSMQGHPVWSDHAGDPESPEAVFCVMPRDARDPSLDRVAAELVAATEALELEERIFFATRGVTSSNRLYCPAIVTTANVTVCSFDPTDVSLDSGTIPDGSEFVPSPIARYTKQFSTHRSGASESYLIDEGLTGLAKSKERTVLIVQAAALDAFLTAFKIDGRDYGR